MLGISANIPRYKTLPDVADPKGFLSYMFSGIQGVAYRVLLNWPRKNEYIQFAHRTNRISDAVWENVEDGFTCFNSFWRKNEMHCQLGRDEAHVKRLGALYVDIDYYKLGLSEGYVLAKIYQLIEDGKIPDATFINRSGQGLTFILKLRNEDIKAYKKWKAVELYLVEQLREVGADENCVDAARILRVPGTINSKNGKRVSVLEFNDVTYSLYDLMKEYDIKPLKRSQKVKKTGVKYPYGHATDKQRKYVRDLAEKLNLTEAEYPDFTNFTATNNWIRRHRALEQAERRNSNILDLDAYKFKRGVAGGYCADISKLLLMRQGQIDCYREVGEFLFRYYRRVQGATSEEALRDTLELNARLDCPLPESEVRKATASADRRIDAGKEYRYRKETIIARLHITKEELEQLPFLGACIGNLKERRSKANRRAYESRLAAEGKVAKKDAILERRAQILALQDQGMKAEEIWQELNISKATYYRDIAALATEAVLEAARALLEEKAEQIINTVEEATEVIADAVGSIKKENLAGAIRAALNRKNETNSVQSHKFSRPFEDKYSYAVPHRDILSRSTKQANGLAVIRGGDRASGDDPDDSSALPWVLAYPKK